MGAHREAFGGEVDVAGCRVGEGDGEDAREKKELEHVWLTLCTQSRAVACSRLTTFASMMLLENQASNIGSLKKPLNGQKIET